MTKIICRFWWERLKEYVMCMFWMCTSTRLDKKAHAPAGREREVSVGLRTKKANLRDLTFMDMQEALMLKSSQCLWGLALAMETRTAKEVTCSLSARQQESFNFWTHIPSLFWIFL
jgi:hypothetical protein